MLRHTSAAPNDFSHVSNPSRGDFIYWSDSDGSAQRARANTRVAHEGFGRARQARATHNYPKKINYEGEYWLSRNRRHVWFESLFERSALMRLDYLFPIVEISAQPMCIVFDDGHRVYPDYFALHDDGRRVVYEVKTQSRLTDEVIQNFRATAEICWQVGWEFAIISDFPTVAQRNLEWLANYRQTWFRPSPERRRALVRYLPERFTIGDAFGSLDAVNPGQQAHLLFNLIWDHTFSVDGSHCLGFETVVTRNMDGDHRMGRSSRSIEALATESILPLNRLVKELKP